MSSRGNRPVRKGAVAQGPAWRWLPPAVLLIVLAGCPAEPEGDGPAQGGGPSDPGAEAPRVEAGALPDGPLLIDRASEAGLDFVHFNGMSGEYYFAENMGSGVALFDYDGDGDQDVLLLQGAMLDPARTPAEATFPWEGPGAPRDRLFRNDSAGGELRFVDATEGSGLGSAGYSMGVATGDIDNDGDIDVYVTGFGPNHLYRNRGDGSFEDITASSGTGDDRFGSSAAFFDYDRDGLLDLYVANYTSFRVDTHTVCRTPSDHPDYCSPATFSPVPDRLFRNLGEGRFEDRTLESGVAAEFGNGLGVVAADYDGDGWIDLYVANDQVANQMWINRKDGTFENVALLAGVAFNFEGTPEASMGIDAADYDGDGDEDLFMSHFAEETNTLYTNLGEGLFEDRTAPSGLGGPSAPFTGFGTAWFDLDNDGWLDLLVANGAVKIDEARLRAGDPYPLDERNQLFHNVGGRFVEVTGRGGALGLSAVSRGAAFGDVDNDGDTDVLLTNNSGPVRLLINEAATGAHWLGLRLVDRQGGRDQLGARVAVERDGLAPLWRRARSDASYCSANDPRVLFGLGQRGDLTGVRVAWPDGSRERFEPPAIDAWHTLVQGAGAAE